MTSIFDRYRAPNMHIRRTQLSDRIESAIVRCRHLLTKPDSREGRLPCAFLPHRGGRPRSAGRRRAGVNSHRSGRHGCTPVRDPEARPPPIYCPIGVETQLHLEESAAPHYSQEPFHVNVRDDPNGPLLRRHRVKKVALCPGVSPFRLRTCHDQSARKTSNLRVLNDDAGRVPSQVAEFQRLLGPRICHWKAHEEHCGRRQRDNGSGLRVPPPSTRSPDHGDESQACAGQQQVQQH